MRFPLRIESLVSASLREAQAGQLTYTRSFLDVDTQLCFLLAQVDMPGGSVGVAVGSHLCIDVFLPVDQTSAKRLIEVQLVIQARPRAIKLFKKKL